MRITTTSPMIRSACPIQLYLHSMFTIDLYPESIFLPWSYRIYHHTIYHAGIQLYGEHTPALPCQLPFHIFILSYPLLSLLRSLPCLLLLGLLHQRLLRLLPLPSRPTQIRIHLYHRWQWQRQYRPSSYTSSSSFQCRLARRQRHRRVLFFGWKVLLPTSAKNGHEVLFDLVLLGDGHPGVGLVPLDVVVGGPPARQPLERRVAPLGERVVDRPRWVRPFVEPRGEVQVLQR